MFQDHTPSFTPIAAPIYILGLGMPEAAGNGEQAKGPFTPHPLTARADVLIGGRAQLAPFNAHPAEKLTVGADIPALLAAMASNRATGKVQVVLCSGDPLFFGLGARLVEHFADAVRILPAVSSLQAAAALLGLPWEGVRSVSLHGRSDRLPLAHALIAGGPVCILTDARSTPAAVAAYLTERGCTGYRMHVLDDLYIDPAAGAVRAEARACLTPAEALDWPRCAQDSAPGEALCRKDQPPGEALCRKDQPPGEALCRKDQPPGEALCRKDQPPALRLLVLEPLPERQKTPFGLPDKAFAREKNLVTKLPIRAAGLAALGIAPDHVVWDLGAGSGAVGIEAARLACRGLVVAVEKNTDRLEHIRTNRHAFSVPNLEIVPGTLPDILEVPADALNAVNEPGDLPGSLSSPDLLFSPDSFSSAGSTHNNRGEGKPGLPPALSTRPHRIFIGGGLGGPAAEAERTLRAAWRHLLPGGRLVAHCVLLSSLEHTRRILQELSESVDLLCIQASVAAPLAGDLRLEGLNPVFLLTAEKAF